MGLNQKDRLDLIALDAGLGTGESDQRARELIEHNAEAAEYVKGLRRLPALFDESLRAARDEGLSQREARSIAAAVQRRIEKGEARNRPAPVSMGIRRVRLLGIAASVVLMLGAAIWVAWLATPDAASGLAPGVTMVSYPSMAASAGPAPTQRPVAPGERLEVTPDFRTLIFEDGTRAVLSPLSEVVISDDASALILVKGSVHVRARGTFSVGVGEFVSRMTAGTAETGMKGADVRWCVYEGTVEVTGDGVDFTVPAGKVALWQPDDADVQFSDSRAGVPEWVERGLNVQPLNPGWPDRE